MTGALVGSGVTGAAVGSRLSQIGSQGSYKGFQLLRKTNTVNYKFLIKWRQRQSKLFIITTILPQSSMQLHSPHHYLVVCTLHILQVSTHHQSKQKYQHQSNHHNIPGLLSKCLHTKSLGQLHRHFHVS